ncbi:MAG: DoxX family protein [Janthinobacterium lividum]
MTLLRAAYRSMLASYFISSGVKAVRNPAPLAPLAEPVADKLVPFVKKYAPDEVAGFIPEDPKTLVRLNGALQIAGGLALATGRGRRVGALLLAGSLVPSTLAKYPFWSQSGDEAAASRSHFAKNVSLLGGVLLASRDTEGKPGIAWRAQAGGQSFVKSTSKATKKLTHSGTSDKLAKQASDIGGAVSEAASDVASKTSDLAGAAVAGGVALLGAAEVATRGTRKNARKQFKVAQEAAAKQAKVTGKRLAEQARVAQKVAVEQAAVAKKAAAAQAAEARKVAAARAEDAQEAAQAAAKQAKKDAKKKRSRATKKAAKTAAKTVATTAAVKAAKPDKHIQRGEN